MLLASAISQPMRRVRHALLILMGRAPVEDRDMALENLQSIINDGTAAADRLIAELQSAQSELAAAKATIADLEAQAAGIAQPLANKLDAAAPAPVTDAAVEPSA